MNATPLLARLLAAVHEQKLEVVLIGNAAAAMHGAPVTTLDFDFMFRDTPPNMRKLKAVAADLGAVILRPFYPMSKLSRMVDDATGLQADFMPVIHGVRSFEGLRSRSVAHSVAGVSVAVASLEDIITSKKAAGPRPGSCRAAGPRTDPPCDGRIDESARGPASAAILSASMKKKPSSKQRDRRSTSARRRALSALGIESERQLDDLIRRRLALPVEQRMNFLRRRLPGGGSCL